MPLPKTWRLAFYNDTNVQVDASKLTVYWRGYYYNTSGRIVYGDWNTFTYGSNLANGARGADSDQANAGDQFDGLEMSVDWNLSTNTATPSGNVELYVENKGNDTLYPDTQKGDPVWSHNFQSKEDVAYGPIFY